MKLSGAHIREWDVGAGVFWDSALKGSSSLRAHLARALDLEVGLAEGNCAMLFLWDMAKFYDSIRVSILTSKLIDLGYPPAIMILGLVLHKAPRYLIAGGCLSDPLQDTGRSILAGCLQSCSWARGMLNELLVELNKVHPRSICYEHVDDLAHTIVAGANRARSTAIMAGKLVAATVKDLDLTLSTKSVLLPGGSQVVKDVVRSLQRSGVPIRAATHGVDVGCDTSAAVRRVATTLNNRIKKSAKRGRRIGLLVKANAAAAKLTTTGTATQQRYGHTAQGASPAQIAAMRKAFKMGSPYHDKPCCTTTAISWTFGTDKDPAVTIPCEQIADWVTLWAGITGRKRRSQRKIWHRKYAQAVKAGTQSFKASNGPMSGTICTLIGMGWKPLAPDLWRTKDGTRVKLDGTPFSKARVLQLAAKSIIKDIWAAAAEEPHHNGGGLEQGPPCMRAARQAKAILIKSQRYLEAKAVDMIIAEFDYDENKISRVCVDGSTTIPNEYYCHRCDRHVINNAWHCYYDCPDNENIEASEVTKTAKFAEYAKKSWDTHRCLWTRGLLPHNLACPEVFSKEVLFEEVQITTTGNFDQLAVACGRGATDGAGASAKVPPPVPQGCLRRGSKLH